MRTRALLAMLPGSLVLGQVPQLHITATAGTVGLAWDEPAVLEETPVPGSGWTPVIGPVAGLDTAISAGGRFFRCYTTPFAVVDTQQDGTYGDTATITPPAGGAPFHGQDAQYAGHAPDYAISGDGLTVLDATTGLTWTRSPGIIAPDGIIDYDDKLAWDAAVAYADTLNLAAYGGYSDWRLPTIKELYSLFDARGRDASSYLGSDTSLLTPFIDTGVFAFGYGDTSAGERLIDAQFWSATEYVGTTMNGDATVFGVNFADGRIKGYPKVTPGPAATPKRAYVLFVRGNPAYGRNVFVDNGDGTVTDRATGLMWQQGDSGAGLTWEEALAYAEALTLGGHDDWRLPNVKELQGIVDYTRSPATHGSAAIDLVFTCSPIIAEDGGGDFPFYWSGTTHLTHQGSAQWAMYVCFGTAYGFMQSPPGSGQYQLLDVHGAGAQRSDPKSGQVSQFVDQSGGHGPQGDVVRIRNHVRCVRGAATPAG